MNSSFTPRSPVSVVAAAMVRIGGEQVTLAAMGAGIGEVLVVGLPRRAEFFEPNCGARSASPTRVSLCR